MQNHVKISVIMGVYCPKSYAHFCNAVESILQQTCQDWEFLIYDDGNPPKVGAKIRSIACRDSRIRYLHGTVNHGLGYALNCCILQAAGQYIARMDDDDYAKPERLEKQAAFLDKNPMYQWVGSNAELIDENGIWGVEKMVKIPTRYDHLPHSPYMHPTVMFRREVLLRHGGYDASRKTWLCEDYELFLRLACKGEQGYNMQEPLLQYREDATSYRKRTLARRIRELRLRRRGFDALGILNWTTIFYVWKPMFVWLIPPVIYQRIRRKQKKR